MPILRAKRDLGNQNSFKIYHVEHLAWRPLLRPLKTALIVVHTTF